MNHTLLSRAIALVVDDHPETLRLLIDTLEVADVTVLVATDGARALEQARKLMPDLILLDAVMPGMDGFETCRALKAGPAPDVPVIFMTGLDDTEHVVQGLEAGGVDYLTKPIAPDELLARIRVHLANARSNLGMRAALDVSGRTMLATDRRGQIRWATPQAHRLLALLAAHPDTPSAEAIPDQRRATLELPDEVRAWIGALSNASSTSASEGVLVCKGVARIQFRRLSRLGDDEFLLTVEQQGGEELERNGIQRLQLQHRLTLREAEVLYWLSGGKANRDIADILGMSPRTVNKHLEHVYEKLGVEARGAAVAAAVRTLRRGLW